MLVRTRALVAAISVAVVLPELASGQSAALRGTTTADGPVQLASAAIGAAALPAGFASRPAEVSVADGGTPVSASVADADGTASNAGESVAAHPDLAPTPLIPAGSNDPEPLSLASSAAGPSAALATAGIHAQIAREAVTPAEQAQRAAHHGGLGTDGALMIVGGAAFIAGLIIGGGAGTAIAIGGAAVGLYGLYLYLQ